MSKLPPAPFYCPNCKSQYRIERAEAGPETVPDKNIPCMNCRAALPAREGAFVLKYLLVHRTKIMRG
jgi:predicted Zn finger-like uncharacterized protein